MKITECKRQKLKKMRKMESPPLLRIGKINFVKMATLPKETYRFNAMTIKMQTTFFIKLENKS